MFGLSEQHINRRIKAAALAAGLGDGFSGHSGRVGMARRMTRNGAPLPVVMRQGRWESERMPARVRQERERRGGAGVPVTRGTAMARSAGSLSLPSHLISSVRFDRAVRTAGRIRAPRNLPRARQGRGAAFKSLGHQCLKPNPQRVSALTSGRSLPPQARTGRHTSTKGIAQEGKDVTAPERGTRRGKPTVPEQVAAATVGSSGVRAKGSTGSPSRYVPGPSRLASPDKFRHTSRRVRCRASSHNTPGAMSWSCTGCGPS